jgi:hypothetical protein
MFLSLGMIFSSQSKLEQARTLLFGQVHAKNPEMRPHNGLDAQIFSFFFFIPHCRGDFSQIDVLTERLAKGKHTKHLNCCVAKLLKNLLIPALI